jgi:hypothetical protein
MTSAPSEATGSITIATHFPRRAIPDTDEISGWVDGKIGRPSSIRTLMKFPLAS